MMSIVSVVAGVIIGANGVKTIGDATADPLKPILDPTGQVSPDKLAEEIDKDPAKKARLKEIKSFVEHVSKHIDASDYSKTMGGFRE